MRARNGIEAHKRKLFDRVINELSGSVDAKTLEKIKNVKLPWYAIKNAVTDVDESTEEDDDSAPVSPDKEETEDDEPEAEILIYSEIGGSFGVSAEDFISELNAIQNKRIAVRLNSPGGSLFDSIAIYNALVKKSGEGHYITSYVDALAASGASIIAMAGDEVCMMVGSQLMIHDALGIEQGNAADMAAMSTFLDRQSDNIATIYKAKAGGTNEEWRALMLAETWLFAEEAVTAGLANRVYTRPTQKQEGEALEAEVEEEEDEETPDIPGESTEEDEEKAKDEELENLMSVRHSLAPYNYKYKGRKAAPTPAVHSTHDDSIQALRDVFGKGKGKVNA